MLQEFSFDSKKNGTRLLILGAIHGNEVAGTKACRRVIEDIALEKIVIIKGSLVLVPIANPQAYEKDVRQIDENLNRVIKKWENPKTYEQNLGLEIYEKIQSCDIVLDLHSTHNQGEVAFSFLDYPTKNNSIIVDALDVDYVLAGWPEVYCSQEAIADFSTEKCAHSLGKDGITLECGYHKDDEASDIAYNSIINLLKKLGMIEGSFVFRDKKIITMTNIVIKQKNGRLVENFKHFDFISKGSIIAVYDDKTELVADKDCYIIIPNHKAEIGEEWYYIGEL